jgi:8-oxo-dGTP diphosphatase
VSKVVHVAVGVIAGADGRILIAKRPDNVHQGGLWEFPGGKVDKGELAEEALIRELREELALEIVAFRPLIQIRHDYADKSVLLDVFRVTDFDGVACGNEGQPIRWVNPDELNEFEFPAANAPIIQALCLPDCIAITGDFSSIGDFTAKFHSVLKQGVKLIQLRIAEFNLADHSLHLQRAVELVDEFSAQLVLNCDYDQYMEIKRLYPEVDFGLHLNRHALQKCQQRPVSKSTVCGASCHDYNELAQAQMLNLDYVLISPVLSTLSHPNSESLGWLGFAALVEGVNIPAYALGGLGEDDVGSAIAAGGQGVAGISYWWDQ